MSNPEHSSGDNPESSAGTAKRSRPKSMNLGKRRDSSREDKQTSTIKPGAGMAGIGGGTLLAALAKNLPDSNEWKSWMIVLAPSASVLLTAAWTWVNRKIDSYVEYRKTENAIEAARAEFDRVLQSEHLSSEARALVVKEREEFEQTVVGMRVSKFKLYINKFN